MRKGSPDIPVYLNIIIPTKEATKSIKTDLKNSLLLTSYFLLIMNAKKAKTQRINIISIIKISAPLFYVLRIK